MIPHMRKNSAHVSTLSLVLAFASVYTIWGSTYLAIRYAVETLPPFTMAGLRFLLAGLILYVVAVIMGAPRPTRANWRATFIVGAFLMLGGNGLVCWAEQKVPSGVTALLVSTAPLWMVVMDWLRPQGIKPGKHTLLGLFLGFIGLFFLIGPTKLVGAGGVDLWGAMTVVLASFFWAWGTIYSTQAALPRSTILATAMEMIGGGVCLLAAGFVAGEPGRLQAIAFTSRSLWAMAYLIVFGSLVGFTSFSWLLTATTPARVSTYAYVNPVVAVLIGWAFAGEVLTLRMALASAVIITGVVLIITDRSHRRELVAEGQG